MHLQLLNRIILLKTHHLLIDVFHGIEEIFVLSQNDDISNINYNVYQCIIFEKIAHENNMFFDNILTLEEGEKYELRMIMTTLYVSGVKYDACIYSRHGGCHKKWWL